MKAIYLTLAVLGAVVPYAAFGGWLVEHGLAVNLLLREASGSPVAAFAWADVVVSAATLLVFMLRDGNGRVRHAWLAVLGLLMVGVSLAFPLYLYLRERSVQSSSRV